jgi:hypothetical protein
MQFVMPRRVFVAAMQSSSNVSSTAQLVAHRLAKSTLGSSTTLPQTSAPENRFANMS